MKAYTSQTEKVARTVEVGSRHMPVPSILEILGGETTAFQPEKEKSAQWPVQRVMIPATQVLGMTYDLDTEKEQSARSLIENLCLQKGKRDSLVHLRNLLQEKIDEGYIIPNSLFEFIDKILYLPPSKNPNSKKNGSFEKYRFTKKLPSLGHIDPEVQRKLRIWIQGDIRRGISWKSIGLYLQGRLPEVELSAIGELALMKAGNEEDVAVDTAARGKAELDSAIGELNGALDQLPAYEGVSYRQANVAGANVYGGLINVGDFIQDQSFWSTSALKIDGSAGIWGSEGTDEKPRVYFIIDGYTGRYVSQYAGVEVGQHEVLFKNGMVFHVLQIANYQNRTFFVHLKEINPAHLSLDTPLKNPYTGAAAAT